jgi:hypothetical protein
MGYRLYSNSTGEPFDTVEMHVLAKAYRAAWRAVHGSEPAHCHILTGLDLLIDFESETQPRGLRYPTGRR